MEDNSNSKSKNAKPANTSIGHASSMAELLQKQKTSFISVKKGEIVKGTITKLSPSEILVDIHGKANAVVLEKEKRLMKQLLGILSVGDEVTATVLNPESDLGYTVVSLRRFLEERVWNKLEEQKKAQEKITVVVRESTKGGFIVETPTTVTGFLPNSHISVTQNQLLTGKTLEVVIVELDREDRKVVFSQKAVSGEADFKKAKSVFKPGSPVTVTVINVTSFGIFASVPLGEETFIDGLIHISEIAWEKVEDIASMFVQGEQLETVVIGFDEQAKRIDLSIKRLTADPFSEVMNAFPADKKVTASVTEVTDQGVVLDLGRVGEMTIEGMIRNDKIPPGTTYTPGQTVTATVAQVDAKKRRVLLVPVLKEKPIGYR